MRYFNLAVLAALALACSFTSQLGHARHLSNDVAATPDCNKVEDFDKLRNLIRSYKSDVDRILEFTMRNQSERTWHELAEFCDTFGPRLSGSKSLESAIEYMKSKMIHESGLEVSAEPVMIPKWEVYEQWAEMTLPRVKRLNIVTLGSSVSTEGTLERQIVLVHDFDELAKLGAKGLLKDKIVVYNYKFTDYPSSVKYRAEGASRAAKFGAAAALVRSVTPFSIDSPHAGMSSRSIPTAALTVEDAELIERLIGRGLDVKIKLHISTRHFDDVQSFNLVGQITGSSRRDEVVLVSGHIDSWFNTDGAMDDGGGMMISYRALDVLNRLGLRGARTIRAVLWTSEEFGLIGAQAYVASHKRELDNFKCVIESDEGTFSPRGFGFANLGELGQCAMREILALQASVGAQELVSQFEGSDIQLFTDAGVPGLSLYNQNDKYFYFHHTAGDSMTVEDPVALDKATAMFAATTYVLSQLDIDLRK